MTPELAITLAALGVPALYGLVRVQLHECRRWRLARRMERRLRGIR